MKQGDWTLWVEEHTALLGMDGPIAAHLFGAWKPRLANCTLEELRDCSQYISKDASRASMKWATHYGMIRDRLHERRQARIHSGETIEKKLQSQPADSSGFSMAEWYAKRNADRHKSNTRRYPDGVAEILDGIGNEADAKLPRKDDPLNA